MWIEDPNELLVIKPIAPEPDPLDPIELRPKVHQNTHWKNFDVLQVKVIAHKVSNQNTANTPPPPFRLQLPNGQVVFYHQFPVDATCKQIDVHQSSFLMDFQDVKLLESKFQKTSWEKSIKDMLGFMNFYHHHNIPQRLYLRTMCFDMMNRADTQVVLTQDVYCRCILFFKLTGIPMPRLKEILTSFLKSHPSGGHNTVLSMKLLKEIFKWFNVNQECITLVPEPHQANSISQMLHLNHSIVTTFLCPQKKILTHVSQLIFHVFQTVVCSVSWSTVDSDLREDVNKFKKEIIEEMENVRKLRHNVLHEVQIAEDIIKKLENHETHKTLQDRFNTTPLTVLKDYESHDTIDFSFYLHLCSTHQLPIQIPPEIEKIFEIDADYWKISVWKARVLFLRNWTEVFFGEEFQELKDLICQAIMFKMPLIDMKSEDDFWNAILDRDVGQMKMVRESLEKAMGVKIKSSEQEPETMKYLQRILEYSAKVSDSKLSLFASCRKRKLFEIKRVPIKVRKLDHQSQRSESEHELEKLKTELAFLSTGSEDLVEQASKIVERFKTQPFRDSIRDFADSQLESFKCNLKFYQNIIQQNIESIEGNRNIEGKIELPLIPKRPVFPQVFEVWKPREYEIKRHNSDDEL